MQYMGAYPGKGRLPGTLWYYVQYMYIPQKVIHQVQPPLEWWEGHHHHSDQFQALEKLAEQENMYTRKETAN